MKNARLLTKALALLGGLFAVTLTATALFSAWLLDSTITVEHESRGKAIANSIATVSVETLLYRDLSSVQAMIDQYLDTQGVSYVFVEDAQGEVVAHTFSPAVPEGVKGLQGRKQKTVSVRSAELSGVGDVADVCSPILDGQVGAVHVGMSHDVIHSAIRAAVLKLVGLVVAIFVVVGLLATMLVRRLVRPLREMAAVMKDIAEGEGDLTRQLEARGRDEVGETARWFNVFIGKVHDIVARVRAASLRTVTVSGTVAAAAERLSSSAQEQASVLEETAASTGLVNESGQALEEIVTSVRGVNGLMAEIAGTTQQQSSGIAQVNRAVAQMDVSVQQNAAQTEELTTTAQDLAQQAQDLQALVGLFKLLDGAGEAAPADGVGAFPPPPRRRAAPAVRGLTPAPPRV
jgi:methyl-accepting chemotaxis protein